MAVYRISHFPITVQLSDARGVTLRPMTATDTGPLLAFFRRIPEQERFFLKDDVASATVVDDWANRLNYDAALPILAFADDDVVGNAVLIRHRGGYQQHLGEIRVVIDPAYRGRGLGVRMMRELVDIAYDADLEQIVFNFVAGIHDEAISAARQLGALPAGVLPEMAKDPAGGSHDVVYLRIPLGKWWQWWRMENEVAATQA